MSSGVASLSCHTDSRYWVIGVSFVRWVRTRRYAVSSPSPRTGTAECDRCDETFSSWVLRWLPGQPSEHPTRGDAGSALLGPGVRTLGEVALEDDEDQGGRDRHQQRRGHGDRELVARAQASRGQLADPT